MHLFAGAELLAVGWKTATGVHCWTTLAQSWTFFSTARLRYTLFYG